MTAGGLEVAVDDGRLVIVREGRTRKFVRAVEQLSFSAARSRAIGQDVLYVTERAVFRLDPGGRLELIEVAPGVDVREHVLSQMDFEPLVRDVRPMPPHLFAGPAGP
jgi:propionate CoA-transferase